ncbi:hypothetical protein D187_007441 [Cystobacter fuscus DSM 2262]|uniref:Uncharacterized protein n=1 Tax=Cystobacter fuscus (strain ATCC 25194 / DSM 2262 / NBRC 100088 / M29) TaxID=1242864 RepID=S9Q479_CYSF2|nr:hypothetical protein D187_007441 [Cystobacter fuscus DSM 2262]
MIPPRCSRRFGPNPHSAPPASPESLDGCKDSGSTARN